MKKTTFKMLAGFVLVVGSTATFAQPNYCLPLSSIHCSFDDFINNFSTAGGITNITNNGSGCAGPTGYQFISNQSVTVNRGASFNFSVQSGSNFSQGFRIWIDYNQDGDFLDVGEDVWNSVTSSTAVFNGSITVPLTAHTGSTRMRVRSKYTSVPADPCAFQPESEVEDYIININQQVAYCVAQYSDGCGFGDYINNFSTTGGSTNITNNVTGCGGGNTNQTVTCFQGGSFNVSMQSAPPAQGFGIWIDYNQDGDFLDVGELVYQTPNASSSVFTGTINVPTTATVGITKMRVRCAFMTVPTDPCAMYSLGEAEDYFIYIPGPLDPTGATTSPATICSGDTATISATGIIGTATWYAGSCVGTLVGTGSTLTVTPTATTTYFVRNFNGQHSSNGCASVTVTVNPAPVVVATAALTALCIGESDTLTATGASSYTWSTGGTSATEIVSPTSTTSYTVTGTDVSGCVNTATVTVNVNALPTVALGADSTQCGGSITLDAQNAGANYMWSDSTTAQTLTVTASGTYSVMVTDTNGCMNSDSINVTINSNPTVALGADSAQCGGTITLDAQNAGAAYMWNDSTTAQTLTVSATGTYYVTVVDGNGCEGSDTVNVTINTPPTVTGTASASTVCVDDADVTLTGAPTGGSWAGPGVSGTNFDPSVGAGAQTLTYSFTDNNGCSGTATVTVTVDACVGVAENTLAEGVNVYPNPNNGVFTLAINANVGDVVIEMVDMQGRVVYAANENNVQTGFTKQISLETQASGLYIIRLTSATEQHTLRVNVQK